MKNLIIIIFLLFVGSYVFGQKQNDSIKIYWENGNLKYHEYLYSEVTKHSDDREFLTLSFKYVFYNKSGLEISKEAFISNYGTKFIDSLNIYKDSTDLDKQKVHREKHPTMYLYEDYIKEADNYFFKKNYTKSTEYYKLALKLLPDEEYPAIQLTKLKKLLIEQNGFGEETSLDCSFFKTGTFSFEIDNANGVKIKRGKTKQIEYHPESKSKVISKVEWTSECEFILTCIKVNKEENKKYIGGKLTVKIISTTSSSYSYKATFQNGVSQESTHYKLK